MSRSLCLVIPLCCALAWQSSPAQSQESHQDPPVLRQKVQVVTLTASVVDRHNKAISGLTREDFELYEDKIKQKIEYFANVDVPLSIGIIFDASASMSAKLGKAKEALKAFVAASHPNDDYFLITFNRQARLIADFAHGDEVLCKMNSIRPEGNTALYDAVFLGLEKLEEARHKKRVLLVISDGQDNCSRYNLRQLGRRIKENDALIYAFSIAEVTGGDCGQLCQMYSRRVMEDLAEVTGGKAFFPLNLEDLEQATVQVALELRQQYSLGYVPTNAERDSKWRKINLRVRPSSEVRGHPSKIVVRTKEGYFATP